MSIEQVIRSIGADMARTCNGLPLLTSKAGSRHREIILLAIFASVSLLFSNHDVAAAEDTAVAYQINVAHTGIQHSASLTPPFVLRWRITLPALVSYPLVADGLVFVTVGDNTTAIATLYALDQSSGQTVWSQPLPQPPPIISSWANAAYDNGRVFAIGRAGVMTAYDSRTGVLLWTTKLPFQYAFSAPPTAANGVVYLGGAGTGGTLFAVDETTGSVLATQSVMNGDMSSPTLSDDSVFVGYAGDQVYGFTQGVLALRWHYSTCCEGGGGKTTVYDSDRVFTRDIFLGNLILDAASGDLIGTFGPPPINFTSFVAPAINGSKMWSLYAGTLSAQDLSTPSNPLAIWNFTGDGQLVTAPILLSTPRGVFVIEGSASGKLYALQANTGSVVWNADVGTPILQPDEQNVLQPLTGLGAGQGLLIVPAGSTISAFSSLPSVAPSVAVPALSEWTKLWLIVLLACFGIGAMLRIKGSQPSYQGLSHGSSRS